MQQNTLTFRGFIWHTLQGPYDTNLECKTMTIEDYRIKLGWSKAELAKRADIDTNTLNRAINGIPVYKHTAGKIASALSQGLGYEITYKDLDGVKFID